MNRLCDLIIVVIWISVKLQETYLKNIPLQSVSSEGNLHVVDATYIDPTYIVTYTLCSVSMTLSTVAEFRLY